MTEFEHTVQALVAMSGRSEQRCEHELREALRRLAEPPRLIEHGDIEGERARIAEGVAKVRDAFLSMGVEWGED